MYTDAHTYTQIPMGAIELRDLAVEKHPGGLLEGTDPQRFHMCQYVNMCIWMRCSVFVFRDLLYSTMWPLLCCLCC